MSLLDYPAGSIAEFFGYDPGSVRRWIQRFNQGSLMGLEARCRHGRPGLGDPGLGPRSYRLLTKPRAWTVGRLWIHLGSAISLQTLHRRVHKIARWRRPRLVANGDPEHDAVVAQLREQLTKLPQGSDLLAEDETHVDHLPWLRATWIVGPRQKVMIPGSKHRATIFGAIDMITGGCFHQESDKANSASFIDFLDHLLRAYCSAPVIAIVLNNLSSHNSHAVQAWLECHPKVQLLYDAR